MSRLIDANVRFTPPAGWKKQSYHKLADRLEGLLTEFSNVELEYRPIIDKALDIMQETGFDCVDCLLMAERILYNHTPVSVDKDLTLIR
ncbi:MAG: hypothetical protein HFF73_13030 [Oscillospiraceae bacterium]|nr:hypothetical protein [Oscillospiraceae bacterium]